MITISLLNEYKILKEQLKLSHISDYSFDAKEIVCHFFDCTQNDILSDKSVDVDEKVLKCYYDAVKKRTEGYPLQYIVGEWEFYGYPFKVGDGVLIPRADTETLIDAVKSFNFTDIVIADLCSGSGCIAITLKKEIANSDVYAVELYDKAFDYLEKNIKLNSVDIKAIKGNVLYNETLDLLPCCDVIVSNPPYLTKFDMQNLQKEVEFEPDTALSGGIDGLYFYNAITSLWKDKLKTGGYIFFEIGMGQEKDVSKILTENQFTYINYYKDLNGIVRVISAKKI